MGLEFWGLSGLQVSFFRSIEPIGLVFSIEGDRIGPFGVAVVGCYFATSGEYCVHYSDIGGIAANAVYRT